jgi:hypothetical protein
MTVAAVLHSIPAKLHWNKRLTLDIGELLRPCGRVSANDLKRQLRGRIFMYLHDGC